MLFSTKQIFLFHLTIITLFSVGFVDCTYLEPVGDIVYDVEDVIKNINILCYKETLQHFDTYTYENIQELVKQPTFDKKCRTILYVPGLGQTLNETTTDSILKSYYSKERECLNVCQLNYTHYSQKWAPGAFLATDTVGDATSRILKKLFDVGVNLKKFWCIGHSLGAQVCGAIGRHIEDKIRLILGLDPAGPTFNVAMKHIEKGQADCVICIHTDLAVYGVVTTECDVQVYPNGGKRYQPGCPKLTIPFSLTKDDFCSHHHSVYYWAEALENPESYLVVKCEKKPKLLPIPGIEYVCDEDNPIELTHLPYMCLNKGFKGDVYFETRDKEPFGMGRDGIKQDKMKSLLSLVI